MSTHHPTFKSSGFGGVFKSLTRTLKASNSSKNVPVLINPTVVGGGQDVQMLFMQLQLTDIMVRAQAAHELSESLRKFPISSIPEVWYLIRDMCDRNSKYRLVALKLLVQCIEHNDNSVGTRLMFFKDIMRYCQPNDPDYLKFILALTKLTNKGKDIHEFCIFDDKNNLYSFFNVHLEALVNRQGTSEEENKTVKLINGCMVHNITMIDDSFVRTVLTRMVQIGERTNNIDTKLELIKVIQTILISGKTLSLMYPFVFRHLCSTYALYNEERLEELIIQCFTGMLSDIHVVISVLCEQMNNSELQNYKQMSINPKAVPLNACVGAIIITMHVIVYSCSVGNFDIECSYQNLLKVCKKTVDLGIPTVNTAFLRSFDKLFLKDAYEENFGITLNISLNRILPFNTWSASAHTSVYDVLRSLRINSQQDHSYLQSICTSLQVLYENYEIETPKDRLIDFLQYSARYLSDTNIDFILKYYREENLCTMVSGSWIENSTLLLNNFYYNSTSSPQTRTHCLQVIKNAYVASSAIFSMSSVQFDLIFDVLRRSVSETDPHVVEFINDQLFTYVAHTASAQTFSDLCNMLIELFGENTTEAKNTYDVYKTLVSISSMSQYTPRSQAEGSMSNAFAHKLAQSTVEVFLFLSQKDGKKAERCYRFILAMYANALKTKQIDVLLVLSKCLVRLRVTSEKSVYFTNPDEMIALSTLFKRYVNDESFSKENAASYKWVYPESLPYMPEHFFNKPSRVLLLRKKKLFELYLNERTDEVPEDDETDVWHIDISPWLENLTTVITEFIDWELYSFTWAHLCSQLSNLQLFNDCDDQIINLKDIICQQLTLQLPPSISLPGGLFTKADLQVAFVRSLSAFIGYHHKFTKQDEDQIVNSLIYGLDSWEKTAIPCINILTVCCYEMPLSIKKFLIVILTKLQVRMSGVFISTHILEFLMSLVYLPSLTSNFTLEEFRSVFALAFKYIRYAKEMKSRTLNSSSVEILQKHGVDAKAEELPSNQYLGDAITPVLADYILSQSFKVISSWFLKVHMNDRKKLSSFIIKNLILCNNEEKKEDRVLDEQMYAFIDFVIRYTYSDFPLTVVHTSKSLDFVPSENVSINHWMMGFSILSLATSTLNGDCKVLVRRPTGTGKFTLKSDQAQLNAQTAQTNIIGSNYYLLQLFNNMDLTVKPVPILEDSLLLRSISVLDRIPTVDFHKVGIMYIGPSQSKEDEILLNRVGSKYYNELLDNIGDMVKLKGANNAIHVGGLDTENGMDGDYSIYWRDKTTQVMFHVPTMMYSESTAHMNDKMRAEMKKRHIGNNYVNIFYNDSGLPFDFNVIKSQFNFLNIVVSPHTKSTNRYESTSGDIGNLNQSSVSDWEKSNPWSWDGDQLETTHQENDIMFFKVKTYRRSGVPGVLATSHFKLVSRENLAVFIRNLCITASEFANVWHASSGSGYKSHWAQRVTQIENLRERVAKSHEQLQEDMNGTHNSMGVSEARYEYLDDTSSHVEQLYKMVEFNLYTC